MINRLIFISLFFIECNYDTGLTKQKENKIQPVVEIQPFVGFSSKDADIIFNEMKKAYPLVVMNKSIDLPSFAFYKLRNRYRADSIIHFLQGRTIENHFVVGLTDKDISTTKGEISDWGVMGLGFCPGKACVASSFRVSKKEKLPQLFKVAIHELGHTQGLPHCTDKACIMRDAEGKNPTNEEKGFCVSCKKYLFKKGWTL
jgi:archaemetzincin